MKKSKYIILALSYVMVHILLMIWVLNTDTSFNYYITFIVYLMWIPEYFTFTFYPMASSMKKVWIIIPEEKNLDFSSIKNSDWFINITLILCCITVTVYGIFLVLLLATSSPNDLLDIAGLVFTVSIIIGYMMLSPCLAMDAHINKRHIEKYFHLLYMVFAPISPFLPIIDIGDYPTREAFHNAFDTFIVIVISIPFLFVLRNYYLWYRRYTKERNNPSKD